MFSKTCEYAIRALLYIAQQSDAGHKVGFRQIAQAIDAPEPFLAKILQDLTRKGLLQSAKGPNGGFFVATMDISLAAVVRAIDGDKLFSGCGLGLPNCSETNPCPIHQQFKSVRAQIQKMLQSSTIGDFNDLIAQGLVRLKSA